MKSILFFDTEVSTNSQKITDIGAVNGDASKFHSGSINDFAHYLQTASYICGHNIFNHDLKYLYKASPEIQSKDYLCIDTLMLSPLLFPKRPYHALTKGDKIQSDELNNPVNDAIKAKNLFYDELHSFQQLEDNIQDIFFLLLNKTKEFSSFFKYINYRPKSNKTLSALIKTCFSAKICSNVSLDKIIAKAPIELAYSLALINCADKYSIPPAWVINTYPLIKRVTHLLRNNPCAERCVYCKQNLDAVEALKKHFGFDSYRTYEEEPLQENAVNAAIENKSLLAIFPTGGGKSITFQVPALMDGENTRGLTIVISPLQSLMKDQVDNLEKSGITDAVTINGLLDPIERGKSFERVTEGTAHILYISPESLRSKSIERLLLGRRIARFVIDEAHCFSSWGHDFRVDYMYIGDFIKNLQDKKNLRESIPVSCFTATAKQQVVTDICGYFKDKLNLKLEILKANTARKNLHYCVYNKDEEDKYTTLRNLIEQKNCPSIVYVSRVKKAHELAEKLNKDGMNARPYHGKLDANEKTENQNAFINGNVQIMVATSAFGMGVDKKDVGVVIHYNISDSLENYVQEAGRAGRDEKLKADCYVLFNEEDLNKHFVLLNQTKLSLKEIQQIWRAIKDISKTRAQFSNSALEIARKAGWDDSVSEIETRVRTAVSALEHSGYIKRGQNSPRIFATSILCKNAQEAIDRINKSTIFNERQKISATRIIKKLFSTKSSKHTSDEEAESRVDYIADHLGIVKEEIFQILSLLKEEKILADTKDLTAFIQKEERTNRSLQKLKEFGKLETCLLNNLEENEKDYNLKSLNELAAEQHCETADISKIKTILNFWSIKNWIKRKSHNYSKNHVILKPNEPKKVLIPELEKRLLLAQFILTYLFTKIKNDKNATQGNDTLVEFSVCELKEAYEITNQLFKTSVKLKDIENTLYYLSKIGALKIEGGFMVIYNKMQIERLEQNNKKQYKSADYAYLEEYYKNKMQQIHIVGEYAKIIIEDYTKALHFVDDYFQLDYKIFLKKYFPGSRGNEIRRNITPAKFKQLFGELSPVQLKIINDNSNQRIVVAAGPGSGKTKVLVHKLASLLLMEEVKHEQLLMLTFSRASANEFKKRLLGLIGNAACFVEIKTFHSYCFDLLGKNGTLESSTEIIKTATHKMRNGEVEPNHITKSVLVIDEAQDMDEEEYELVKTLIAQNDEIRIIAVGDDDQNIYTFRGADSKYFEQFLSEEKSIKYELVENYRSRHNLVAYTNSFVNTISERFKSTPILAHQKENGKINIYEHTGNHLIMPLVDDVTSCNFKGSSCILTKFNDETMQITGLLVQQGVAAKLIQSNDGFNLHNLHEVRHFIHTLKLKPENYSIPKDNWINAKKLLKENFESSKNYKCCYDLIKTFETINPKTMYQTDFEVFVHESKIEDFATEEQETIFVSTIHKAKGKEFCNVFLVLTNFNLLDDNEKREVYVAMTRAKQNLSIHINNKALKEIEVDDYSYSQDSKHYKQAEQITILAGYHDVNLGYFDYVQQRMKGIIAGQTLKIIENELANNNNERLLKFSHYFKENTLDYLSKKGYRLVAAKVNFVLYWTMHTDNEEEKEIKILLPELCFKRV